MIERLQSIRIRWRSNDSSLHYQEFQHSYALCGSTNAHYHVILPLIKKSKGKEEKKKKKKKKKTTKNSKKKATSSLKRKISRLIL
jgi:hypothetical protein